MRLARMVDTHHIPYTVDTTPYTLCRGYTIVDTKLCCHTLFHAPTPSLPPHKKLSKINIVFDFLTTEYFLNLACVKFKPFPTL